MKTETILMLIALVVLAAVVSYYQYIYKAKKTEWTLCFLAFLRFCSIIALGLLLINPMFKYTHYQIVKPQLHIAIDNSSSISFLKQEEQLKTVVNQLITNNQIKDQFEIHAYQFDREIQVLDTLNFKVKQTNIEAVGTYLNKLRLKDKSPVVLISDGNANLGGDYTTSFGTLFQVNSVIIGDTITTTDLYVARINTNTYALEGNDFPVELFIQYNGNKAVTSEIQIKDTENQVVFKQPVIFSDHQNSTIIQTHLPTKNVGVNLYTAQISPLTSEKNKINNYKKFAIEVINQKNKIAIISSIKHPDLGALKRSILTNKFRDAIIVTPEQFDKNQKYDAVILYQPNANFKNWFAQNDFKSMNGWIITGTQTDYSLINQYVSDYNIQYSSQTENYVPQFNPQFTSFEVTTSDAYPPLQNQFVSLSTALNQEIIYESVVNGIQTNMPLFAVIEKNNFRHAYLFGEGIWRWRLHNYKEEKNFSHLDQLVDQVIQYIAVNTQKKRLEVKQKQLYTTAEIIELEAQYYDKNYKLDWNALLTVELFHQETKKKIQYDMNRGTSGFKAVFENLKAGVYTYQISEKQSKITQKGSFTVIDSDMESHFSNANRIDLKKLAATTQGKVYAPNQIERLISQLLSNETYKPIQKEVTETICLIDWKFIMGIILFLLGLEWFVRKSHGLL